MNKEDKARILEHSRSLIVDDLEQSTDRVIKLEAEEEDLMLQVTTKEDELRILKSNLLEVVDYALYEREKTQSLRDLLSFLGEKSET